MQSKTIFFVALVALTASPVTAAPTPVSHRSLVVHNRRVGSGVFTGVADSLKGFGGRITVALKPFYDDLVGGIAKFGKGSSGAVGAVDDVAVSGLKAGSPTLVSIAQADEFAIKLLAKFPDKFDDIGAKVYATAKGNGPFAAQAQEAFYRAAAIKNPNAAGTFAIKMVEQFGDKADDIWKLRVIALAKNQGTLGAQAKSVLATGVSQPAKSNILKYLAAGTVGLGTGFVLSEIIGKPGQPGAEVNSNTIPEKGALTIEQEDQIAAYLAENPEKLSAVIEEVRLLPGVTEAEITNIASSVNQNAGASSLVSRSLTDLD